MRRFVLSLLFLLPALLILPRFFGVEGALWAGPVGDACAFVLALAFGLAEWRKTARLSKQHHPVSMEDYSYGTPV